MMSAQNRKKVREMLRVIDRTHRRPVIIVHRARPEENEGKEDSAMESYRNQIIAILDTITDAKMMRTIYEVIKAILMNR